MSVLAPFVEALTIHTRISASLTGGMDTSGIDSFRQGVELTRDLHHCQGIIKIHAGEQNHQLPQRQFGMNKEQIDPDNVRFTEIDLFDPVAFVAQQQLTGSFPSITYPIVFRTSILRRANQGNVLDGIIEPLAIRHVAQFCSIDAPFESHAVYGSIESGNHNKFVGSDVITQRYQFDEESLGFHAYEDQADTANGVPTGLGFFPNSSRVISPFLDGQLTNGINLPRDADSNITLAMRDMNPSSDGYAPEGYKISSCGFTLQTHDGSGADSIAYGNLKYRS